MIAQYSAIILIISVVVFAVYVQASIDNHQGDLKPNALYNAFEGSKPWDTTPALSSRVFLEHKSARNSKSKLLRGISSGEPSSYLVKLVLNLLEGNNGKSEFTTFIDRHNAVSQVNFPSKLRQKYCGTSFSTVHRGNSAGPQISTLRLEFQSTLENNQDKRTRQINQSRLTLSDSQPFGTFGEENRFLRSTRSLSLITFLAKSSHNPLSPTTKTVFWFFASFLSGLKLRLSSQLRSLKSRYPISLSLRCPSYLRLIAIMDAIIQTVIDVQVDPLRTELQADFDGAATKDQALLEMILAKISSQAVDVASAVQYEDSINALIDAEPDAGIQTSARALLPTGAGTVYDETLLLLVHGIAPGGWGASVDLVGSGSARGSRGALLGVVAASLGDLGARSLGFRGLGARGLDGLALLLLIVILLLLLLAG